VACGGSHINFGPVCLGENHCYSQSDCQGQGIPNPNTQTCTCAASGALRLRILRPLLCRVVLGPVRGCRWGPPRLGAAASPPFGRSVGGSQADQLLSAKRKGTNNRINTGLRDSPDILCPAHNHSGTTVVVTMTSSTHYLLFRICSVTSSAPVRLRTHSAFVVFCPVCFEEPGVALLGVVAPQKCFSVAALWRHCAALSEQLFPERETQMFTLPARRACLQTPAAHG
jgi:hypothetical protein